MAACSLLVPPHGAAIPRELLLEAACSSLALSMLPFSCPRRAPQLARLAKLQHQLATSCQQLLGVKLSAQTPWKQSPESCRQGRKEQEGQRAGEGSRTSAGYAFSGCTSPFCSQAGFLHLPACPASLHRSLLILFSVSCLSRLSLVPVSWVLPSLRPHWAASSHIHISGYFLPLETGSYPPSVRSQEHHD